MRPEDFVAWLGPVARQVCREYGLPASVCVAQAAVESGWGEYAIGGFNLFGRKWSGRGGYLECPTAEFVDGAWQNEPARFQEYDSLADAVRDWCVLLTAEPVYRPACAYLDDTEKFVQALGPVYVTDPDYAAKVLATIRANGLAALDAPAEGG
jgi:flagellar protein FlgJ